MSPYTGPLSLFAAVRGPASRLQKKIAARCQPRTTIARAQPVGFLATVLACAVSMPHESSAAPPSLKPLSLIVACTSEGGIGNGGQLPWRIPGDMAYFKRVTTDTSGPAEAGGRLNAVVMGRKTWESIPAKFRPLPNRVNVVMSRNPAALDLPAGVLAAESLENALAAVDNRSDIDQCFIIGGAEVYKQALALERLCKVRPAVVWRAADQPARRRLAAHLVQCRCAGSRLNRDACSLLAQVYRTLVHGSHQCDAFIPAELPSCFERDSGE